MRKTVSEVIAARGNVIVLLSANEILYSRLRGLLVALRARAQRTEVTLEEIMDSDGTLEDALALPTRCDVLTTLKKLPEICLTRSKTTGTVIAIRRGEIGFYPIQTRLTPEEFNQRRGISPDQVEAMENGSLLGWEVPAADPDIVKRLRERREAAEASP